tara:strand:+ start:8360 stop:8764 length:405 start_codon:yes stop_codon:yes gene_type:complete
MSDSSSRIPGWVWITTPTLAIAFAGFVIYLSTLPASDELGAVKGDARQALQQGIERAKASVADTVKNQALREAGKPAYDFYRLLEQQKVDAPEVDAYVSTPKMPPSTMSTCFRSALSVMVMMPMKCGPTCCYWA